MVHGPRTAELIANAAFTLRLNGVEMAVGTGNVHVYF
jgi:hypothetical protein